VKSRSGCTRIRKPGLDEATGNELRQLFDYDMLAVNPLDKLEAPKTKRVGAKLYTPEQFVAMLQWSLANSFHIMLQFLALSGLCFMRTAELVRLYEEEEVLRWDDIRWDRKLIHVRGEVAKET
jgi:integrase